jgi:hypothetical protein
MICVSLESGSVDPFPFAVGSKSRCKGNSLYSLFGSESQQQSQKKNNTRRRQQQPLQLRANNQITGIDSFAVADGKGKK